MTLAKCHTCGKILIVADDGQPFWCTECSYEDDLKEQRRRKDQK
jgi:DNA-directed RNA polymerase subunit M/transcription elongation factor TFIIS